MSIPAVRAATLVIDCRDMDRLAAFWCGLLGQEVTERSADWLDLRPLGAGGPVLALQRVPEHKTIKNRLHLDLAVADVRASGERAYDLGATPAGPLHDGRTPWRVWRDPEGNEFCLVTDE